jgi:hypothetical protein
MPKKKSKPTSTVIKIYDQTLLDIVNFPKNGCFGDEILPVSTPLEELAPDSTSTEGSSRIEALYPFKTFDALGYLEETESNSSNSDDEVEFNVHLEEQTITTEPISENQTPHSEIHETNNENQIPQPDNRGVVD